MQHFVHVAKHGLAIHKDMSEFNEFATESYNKCVNGKWETLHILAFLIQRFRATYIKILYQSPHIEQSVSNVHICPIFLYK